MKTIMYLVRHGETVDNARQLMQGQTQGELNEVGVGQAKQLRDKLADRHLDAIVASDLKRSVDTAWILADPHGVEVETTPLLSAVATQGFAQTSIASSSAKVSLMASSLFFPVLVNSTAAAP